MTSVLTSYSKEIQLNHELGSTAKIAGRITVYGSSFWIKRHFDTRISTKRKHVHSTRMTKTRCYNSLGSVPKSLSIKRRSTISHPQELREVNKDDVAAPPTSLEKDVLLVHYIPVYVMLPLNVISKDNVVINVNLLYAHMRALKSAHVDGLMVDVWWGIVEGAGPKQYNWSAYRFLFQLIQSQGLKLQVIMSFHQCGGNVGDSCYIPLPEWILKEGKSNPDIFFTDRDGRRNKECLTFGIDDRPVLNGRTAVEVYSDFMRSFRHNMWDFLEDEVIAEVEVGLGPAGELRYPSFSNSHGWHFPGIGEFQCYDKYLLSHLKQAAENIGQYEWGNSGPQDAGHYNDWPQSTGFFKDHGTFTTDYGRFFLAWYSNLLVQHGDRILEAASNIFVGCKVKLAAKIAGIHWWYKTQSHAAELAAGYYNLQDQDGYKIIAKMLSRHRAVLNFTCIEMRDDDHNSEYMCGPEALTTQVLSDGWNEGICVSCENALHRYDRAAYDQILKNARPDGINKENPKPKRLYSFTYLRLGQEMMQENNWREFNYFVKRMHAYLDDQPEPQKYFHPRVPLQPSLPFEAFQMESAVSAAYSEELAQPDVALAQNKKTNPQDIPPGALEVQAWQSTIPFPFNTVPWLWHNIRAMYQSSNVGNAPADASCDTDEFWP